MKKITNFIYVTTDKEFIQLPFVNIGTNWTTDEEEAEIIMELDSVVRKLIEVYEERLNK